MAAVETSQPLPATLLSHPKYAAGLAARTAPVQGRKLIPHARLRRTSPVAQFVAAAAMEALGGDAAPVQARQLRVGVVYCVMNGCVQYSGRFYKEVLQDASTASPLLFPETVANAPPSHVSALLGSTAPNYTLLGDQTVFAQGLALAAAWLEQGIMEGCLVLAAEELDWPIAGAAHLFHPKMVVGEGAGAIYLSRTPGKAAVRLDRISDLLPWSETASAQVRAQLGAEVGLLCDSRQGVAAVDRLERGWEDWSGVRLSPRKVLGEGFNAAAAWQCVAAAEWLARGGARGAVINLTGLNRLMVGIRLD
jgi:hypothetical protein